MRGSSNFCRRTELDATNIRLRSAARSAGSGSYDNGFPRLTPRALRCRPLRGLVDRSRRFAAKAKPYTASWPVDFLGTIRGRITY